LRGKRPLYKVVMVSGVNGGRPRYFANRNTVSIRDDQVLTFAYVDVILHPRTGTDSDGAIFHDFVIDPSSLAILQFGYSFNK
jgi:hypothetical protein